MADPYTIIFNKIIQELLPKLDSNIGELPVKDTLDPYPQIAFGSDEIAFIDIFYSVTNLIGLSSMQI